MRQFQASAGGGVGDSIVQPHEVHGPASDVHKEHRGFSPYEFWVNGNGGAALWKKSDILNGHLIGDSFKLEAYRLGRTEQVFPERFLFPAESGQGQARAKVHGTFSFFSALLDFFCDSCQGQKVIIVVFHFVSQDRLPAGSAHRILSLVFQRVLQGIWFVPVSCDTGWEGKMPGFDCVVPMIDSNVPVFLILSLALLKIYFFGGKLEKTSCCKGFVLSQPVNPGGECVGERV